MPQHIAITTQKNIEWIILMIFIVILVILMALMSPVKKASLGLGSGIIGAIIVVALSVLFLHLPSINLTPNGNGGNGGNGGINNGNGGTTIINTGGNDNGGIF